jgi:nucleoside-diphosphate-sugar epimerase
MNDFHQQKILVVGGAGFVGSNLVRQLLPLGPSEVVVVDNLLSAERSNVPADPRVRFIEGSITDDTILARLDDSLDYVFHLATFHGNQNSLYDPLADHENNTLTTLKLYDHLKNFRRLKKVVYSSAGCTVAEKTFDEAHATDENAPVSLWLDSPYQMSKIFGEYYSNFYFTRHQLPVVKARFQNVYGPGEILGAGRWRGTSATVWRNVTPTFVYRALKDMPLTVENGGIATRDFIYVEDTARGLIACALRGKPGDVFNLASGAETSILDLATTINRLAGSSTPIDFRPKRDWDRSGKRFGSTDKAEREIGFKAHVSIDDGLGRTVAWTRENLPTIEACMARHRRKMEQAEAATRPLAASAA